MWVIPIENKLAIYKNEQIHEATLSYYFNWLIPHGGTGRIIELNDVTTVFALKSRGCFYPVPPSRAFLPSLRQRLRWRKYP